MGKKEDWEQKRWGYGSFTLASPCTLSLVLSLAGLRGLTAYPLSDSPSWQKAALLP